MRLPRTSGIERWPWPVRALLGCAAATAAVLPTYTAAPLHAFPLLLAFPSVVLLCWYLGMAGGVRSALTDIVLVDLRVTDEKTVARTPSQVQQIFANLVSNAIDAMARGDRLVVRLQSSRHWRDGIIEGMRVTFYDSGTGIERAAMSHLVEPFFTTKTETGTGF